MKKLLLVVSLALLFVSPAGAFFEQYPAKVKPEWFGMVGGVDYLGEVEPYTNINVVSGLEEISRAAAVGKKFILSVEGVFFDFSIWTKENGELAASIRLRPDYAERWLFLVSEILPYEGQIAGFYICDEPYLKSEWAGLPKAQMKDWLNTAAREIKKDFPNKKTITVFYAPMVEREDFLMPEEVDIAGCDFYYTCSRPWLDVKAYFGLVEKIIRLLHDKMSPRQQLVLILDGFYFFDSPVPEDELIYLNQRLYELALSLNTEGADRELQPVIGLFVFIYPSIEGLWQGLRGLEKLKSFFIQLGFDVVGLPDNPKVFWSLSTINDRAGAGAVLHIAGRFIGDVRLQAEIKNFFEDGSESSFFLKAIFCKDSELFFFPWQVASPLGDGITQAELIVSVADIQQKTSLLVIKSEE